MLGKKGFTLVEILFVLIIVAGIVAYAVPSYKRAKERTSYEAAVGALSSVGNAIQSLQNDLAVQEGFPFFFPVSDDGFYQIPTTAPAAPVDNTTRSGAIKNAGSNALQDQQFIKVLFAGYLDKKIKMPEAYDLYAVAGESTAVCNNKCVKGSKGVGLVACMCLKSTTDTSGCFYGAKMYADGRIERLVTDVCSAS